MRVPCPTVVPKLDLVILFLREDSLLGVVVANCSFQLYFHNDDNDEHSFMCFFAISMSSLMKCLFIYFAHFVIKLFVSSLLNSECTLYIIDTGFYQMYFESIFPQ